jgi:hypothetical protein
MRNIYLDNANGLKVRVSLKDTEDSFLIRCVALDSEGNKTGKYYVNFSEYSSDRFIKHF